MWISRYFVLFIIFSNFGWIYETIYCSIKDGYFQNRGFLFGPICPIYGFGAVAVTGLSEFLMLKFNISLTWYEVFIIGIIGSMFLEYGTSLALEKMFHALWWDYSDMPLNLNGRICALASLFFGLLAIIVYYIVFPWTMWFKSFVPPLLMEFLSLILMALITMDATLTVSALTNFAKNVQSMGEAANQNMEMFYEAIKEKKLEAEKGLLELKHSLAIVNVNRTAVNMPVLHKSAINRVKHYKFPLNTLHYSDKVIAEIGKKRIRLHLFKKK